MAWFKIKQSLTEMVAGKTFIIMEELNKYIFDNNLMMECALFDPNEFPNKEGNDLLLFAKNEKLVLEMKKKYSLEECEEPLINEDLTLLVGSKDLYKNYFI